MGLGDEDGGGGDGVDGWDGVLGLKMVELMVDSWMFLVVDDLT